MIVSSWGCGEDASRIKVSAQCLEHGRNLTSVNLYCYSHSFHKYLMITYWMSGTLAHIQHTWGAKTRHQTECIEIDTLRKRNKVPQKHLINECDSAEVAEWQGGPPWGSELGLRTEACVGAEWFQVKAAMCTCPAEGGSQVHFKSCNKLEAGRQK